MKIVRIAKIFVFAELDRLTPALSQTNAIIGALHLRVLTKRRIMHKELILF